MVGAADICWTAQLLSADGDATLGMVYIHTNEAIVTQLLLVEGVVQSKACLHLSVITSLRRCWAADGR